MATSKYESLLADRTRALKRALDRHEKKIAAIVNDFMTSPQRSNAYWNGVRAALNREYREIGALYSSWARARLPQFYRDVVREQMARASKLKNLATTARLSTPDLLSTDFSARTEAILYQSATADMLGALALGQRDMGRLTRMTQQRLVDEALVDKTIADAAAAGDLNINRILSRQGTLANALVQAAEGGRYLTIVDVNGVARRYGIGSYAEMVTRTKWHEAQSQAARAVAANYDTDLVRVSSHNTTTEICQRYEGKVMSISGKDPRFEFLDVAPPFHPNCLHYLTVTFEETLAASGQLDAASAFSRGETDAPPNLPTFIPVKDRAAIVSLAVEEAKKTDAYAAARSPRGRRNVIRDVVSSAIGARARSAA